MTTVLPSPYTSEQIAIWLRGLLTIAWADGQFDEAEKALIAELTHTELAPPLSLGSLEPLAPAELAVALGQNTPTAETFLRTAVMVAIADGIYSAPEDQLLQEFCLALGLETTLLRSLQSTLPPIHDPTHAPASIALSAEQHLTLLRPMQDWLDQLEIHDPRLARFLCKMIPAQCPFERDVTLFGHKIIHIPPLCQLNPLYEQLVGLRFRALSYLADECHEDVSSYC